MCGITGIISPTLKPEDLKQTVDLMAKALAHRGPDDQGIWCDPSLGIAFGHRRLSIIDLSPLGHQPMLSASERYVIVFNGEIYNYIEIRELLLTKGHKFRGASDTEVMLAAIEEWGIRVATQKFNGMFAFVVWDQQERQLHLVRDRIGIKPLYFGWTKAGFVFASELKAIIKTPQFDNPVQRNAIAQFLLSSCIACPNSIYSQIYKLEQGCYLTLKYLDIVNQRPDFSANRHDLETPFKPIQYWSAKEAAERGQSNLITDENTAIDQVSNLIQESVKLRMVSDVPIGSFLSGGIDSSLVTAFMQIQSSQAIRTFSIGFNESSFDESNYAEQVAKHLGTAHTSLKVTPQMALDVISNLGQVFDEPFADSSQIPTILLSKLTRQHVTVALSGDGGDELFSGYERYRWANTIAKSLQYCPSTLRKVIAKSLAILSPDQWNKFWSTIFKYLPKKMIFSMPSDKMQKLSRVLNYSSSESLYKQMLAHWINPQQLVIGSQRPTIAALEAPALAFLKEPIHQMMYMDLMHYLPDLVMVKVDRASMYASIEAREPLLDYRLAELAWSLPLNFKMRGNCSKWILRKILARHIPMNLIDRPKMGFGVPIQSWLKGPLRSWAEDLLAEAALKRQGFLDPSLTRQAWLQFLNSNTGTHYLIWDLLMFQSWLQSYGKF